MSPVRNAARFLKEFVRSPTATGAIAPSSPYLAERIVSSVDLAGATTVVEYGPGTGSFTSRLKPQLKDQARFVAIELNPGFAKSFRKRHPDVRLHEDSVCNVREICIKENIGEVDCIISGLPWATFSDQLQTDILDATMSVLRPGGQFATFAYIHGLVLPKARRFRQKLRSYFSRVSSSEPIWLNVPPAICYACTR